MSRARRQISAFSEENKELSSVKQAFTVPAVTLPKGGGAIKSIEEKFQVNAVNGTSGFSITIPASSSRHGNVPGVELNYNSGNGNSPFGIGWSLGLSSIKRKTDSGLPQYKDADESDNFVLSNTEDLIPLLEKKNGNWQKSIKPRNENGVDYTVTRYRPRIEGLFARIELWVEVATGKTHWRTITKNNIHAFYGLTDESRITNPKSDLQTFEWLLCRSHDDRGNLTIYSYKKEDFAEVPRTPNELNRINECTQTYIKTIFYGNRNPYFLGDAIPSDDDFHFRIVFDYGEHDDTVPIHKDVHVTKNPWKYRADPFSSYRAGFEIRTYRRCSRVMLFHSFDEPDLPHKPYLVRSLDLTYQDSLQLVGPGKNVGGFSYLVRARHTGHRWDAALNAYSSKHLPDFDLTYQQHEWNTRVETVSPEDAANAPIGIDDKQYIWIDLFNEGIAGILTEQASGWFYKANLGMGKFASARPVGPKPSFSRQPASTISLQELEGNGIKYLVQWDIEPKGFFKLGPEEEWEPFKPFAASPNISSLNPNLKPIDLTGDGRADLLTTDQDGLRWYPSAGEKGFEVSQAVVRQIDEEKGPAFVFADQIQSIFIADMSGDGLNDLVRIRNGEICYWPNLGYGRFGAKVHMENAPVFDHPDQFNPTNLRLADIDGSGPSDLVYLGENEFRVWLNLSGNGWTSEPETIIFPEIDNLTDIAVLDFLGTGTACVVYSSPGPRHAQAPLRYIDLMGSKKPHLMVGYQNNCGKEVFLEYKSSTQFYLDDKKEGRPWLTKLPFPVHCISRVRVEDKIRETVFVNSYRYSHGYFDYEEKEFRGFARVEQIDTETASQFKVNAARNVVSDELHQPPVRTISWFHTGAHLLKNRILHQLRSEYFKNDAFPEFALPEPSISSDLSAAEFREALRACKGLALRTETYADDETELSDQPYAAIDSTYEIKLVQPRQDDKCASFQVIPSQSISYGYERNPADPRITHSMVFETDEFGNVTKSGSVVYPRVKRPLGAGAIPNEVWDAQKQLHIVYGETLFSDDIDEGDTFRLRVGYESKSYEISGIPQPGSFFFQATDLFNQIQLAAPIPFEEEFTVGVQKRLSSHKRAYFFKDDLSGPMPIGKLSHLGIGHRSYQLAFTDELVTRYYGTKVTGAMLSDAGYVHSENDTKWWTQSGTGIYAPNPRNNFFTPVGTRDVFGNETHVTYDKYTLLTQNTTDAIQSTTTAVNDYRTLAPVMVIDPNLNRTAIETDELGFVIKTAVMGKDGAGEGDTLADPTSRMEYDFFNWQNNRKPNYVHLFSREQHGASNPRWQESFLYSDGVGSVIMTKVQAEPGKAKIWNAVTRQVDEVNANPRWVGNGRTIVNNKGNPIKQYQPYFSTTSDYENEAALVETGVSPIRYYDPVGRNIRTELPDDSFSRIEFDAWHLKAFDVNDTIKDSQWYASRGSPDPNVVPEPNDPQQRAAWLAAKHYNTPGTVHLDSAARSVYATVDYGNGKIASVHSEDDLLDRHTRAFDQLGRNVSESHTNILGSAIYGKSAEKGERWVFADVMGRVVKVWDDNLREFRSTYDKLNRPVSSFVKEGANDEILFAQVVYGEIFPDAVQRNLKGRAYQLFDSAGVVTTTNIDFKGNIIALERRLTKAYETTTNWHVLDGLTTANAIESAAAPLLESEVFSSSTLVDALNRPTLTTLPDGTVLEPHYNHANFLDSLRVKIRGQGPFVTFLQEQQYDAKGQREFALYGNGLITNYSYDPKTFRLVRLVTKTPTASDVQSLQNLQYTFDAAGNILSVKDDAQQTNFFQNAVVVSENKYEYDAAYQLLKATGREHAGLGANAQRNHNDLPFIAELPHANDLQAVRNYTEFYEYDDCGNITRLQHLAINANWTQHYRYAHDLDPANLTNRLQSTSNPGDPEVGPYTATYQHDLHGNMTKMPHVNELVWNFMDQLVKADLGGGGFVFFVLGLSGTRVRKVVQRPSGKRTERIYLGAVEIYREFQNGSKRLERSTLHVSDNTGRIAQIDTKLLDEDNADAANPLNANLIRYQYSNHLGSARMETDENGVVISYEEYHPYGTSSYRSSKSNVDLSLKRYRFGGKERDDETGFYYFGARYYAPWLGRWTSSDPAGFVDGFNLYRYAQNSPSGKTDSHGTQTVPSEARSYPNRSINLQLRGTTQNDVHFALSIEFRDDQGNYFTFNASGGVAGLRQLHQQLLSNSGVAEALTGQEREQLFQALESFAQTVAPSPPSELGELGERHIIVQPPPPPPRRRRDRPVTTGGGSTRGGLDTVRTNPEGFTLEVPNSFEDDKIAAYRERIQTDRGVGHRSPPPGGGNRTRDIRAANEGLRDAYEASLPGGQRPAGTDIDHTVELQHITRGNNTVRPQDHRVQPSGLNRSQGSSARHTANRQIASGIPEDVPAGGVARSSEIGRFSNSPRFRTALRGAGYGLMVLGPALTAWGASQVDNPYVQYGGYGLAGAEATGAGIYAYGRIVQGGGELGLSAGRATMALGGRIAGVAGGAAQALISGYMAYEDYQNEDWVAFGFDVAAAIGGVALIAAAIVTAPAWAIGLAVVGIVTGVAAGVFHLGRAFGWWD